MPAAEPQEDLLADARAQLDRLCCVADHTPLMLVHCDRDWRYTFVNRTYAERHHTTPEALVGRSIGEVLAPHVLGKVTRYEETQGRYDWGPEEIRLVRTRCAKAALIAVGARSRVSSRSWSHRRRARRLR